MGEDGGVLLTGLSGIGCPDKDSRTGQQAEGQEKEENVWRAVKFGNSAFSTGVGVVADSKEKA